jgi:hypothetical protein
VIAFLDEIDTPKHHRQRFTGGSSRIADAGSDSGKPSW